MKRSGTTRKTGPASYKRTKTGKGNISGDRGAYTRKPTANRVELKRVDAVDALNGELTDTWSTPTPIPSPAQGDAPDQRDGRVIRTKYIQYGLELLLVGGAAQSATVRVIYFSWKNPLVAPSVLNILNEVHINACYEISYAGNYKILSDKLYPISKGVDQALSQVRVDTGVIDNEALQTFYGASATEVSDVRYYVMAVASRGSGLSSPVEMDLNLSQTFINI